MKKISVKNPSRKCSEITSLTKSDQANQNQLTKSIFESAALLPHNKKQAEGTAQQSAVLLCEAWEQGRCSKHSHTKYFSDTITE